MSDEWISAATALGHIERALNLSRKEGGGELVEAIIARRIAIIDRRGEPVILPPEEWSALRGLVRWGKADYTQEFGGWRIRRADVEAEFQPLGAAEAKKSRKGIGGAPTQYEWHFIFREFYLLVRERGEPKNLTRFGPEFFERCERVLGAGRAPDTETLKKLIGFWRGTRKKLE